MLGIDSGRFLSFGLRMYTRFAGSGFQRINLSSASTNIPLASGVLITSLSTPEVFLPRLFCVTLLTLSYQPLSIA